MFVLQADGSLKEVDVVAGNTNGTMTEVIGGDLKRGMKVVTGQLAAGAKQGGAGGGK